jgi:hypothetical protein
MGFCKRYTSLENAMPSAWLGGTLQPAHPTALCRFSIFSFQGFTHIVATKHLLLATDDLLIYVRTFS